MVVDDAGVSDFQMLQNSLSEGKDTALVYYAFDLLYLGGRDLRSLPLVDRKRQLQQLLQKNSTELGSTVRFSAHVEGEGQRFLANACKLRLEGIISKRGAALYGEGRGPDWLKIKCSKRQELAVVGYTEPGGTRSHLGALLLGVMRGKELVYSGRVGTGFTEKSLSELKRRLAPLEVKEPQVVNPPRGAEVRSVHWVKPQLVAEVSFTGITSAGLLRHPTFHGLRDDKTPSEVKLEVAQGLEQVENSAKPSKAAKATSQTRASEAGPLQTDYPITNPGKVLYAEQGITKRELLDYYASVAERMLPHIANRPLTLVRCPNGYGKPCFFQKHPGKGTPKGLRSIAIREKEGKSPYSVLDDSSGLFGLVQLGALEIHTWGSHADDFEHPDLLVFDLDPDPELPYQAVIDCALRLREVFQSANLESFVKTTGGKGIHVCVPIVPSIGWEQAKRFSNQIADALVAEAPNKYVSTVSKAQRRGKIFIDYLRNGRGATFIAPYSTRNRENAPIAVPLEWHELSPKLKPDHFNLRNIHERLADLLQDPFERMAKLKQHLPSKGL